MGTCGKTQLKNELEFGHFFFAAQEMGARNPKDVRIEKVTKE